MLSWQLLKIETSLPAGNNPEHNKKGYDEGKLASITSGVHQNDLYGYSGSIELKIFNLNLNLSLNLSLNLNLNLSLYSMPVFKSLYHFHRAAKTV